MRSLSVPVRSWDLTAVCDKEQKLQTSSAYLIARAGGRAPLLSQCPLCVIEPGLKQIRMSILKSPPPPSMHRVWPESYRCVMWKPRHWEFPIYSPLYFLLQNWMCISWYVLGCLGLRTLPYHCLCGPPCQCASTANHHPLHWLQLESNLLVTGGWWGWSKFNISLWLPTCDTLDV